MSSYFIGDTTVYTTVTGASLVGTDRLPIVIAAGGGSFGVLHQILVSELLTVFQPYSSHLARIAAMPDPDFGTGTGTGSAGSESPLLYWDNVSSQFNWLDLGYGLMVSGGTLVLDPEAAKSTLGLVIGTDVQAYDADLAAIAALTTASYGRSLLTLASAAALASEVDAYFLTPAEGNAAYQPLDSHTVKDNVATVFTRQVNFQAATLTSSSGVIAWDLAVAQSAVYTATEDATLANPTNQVAGGRYVFRYVQHASATRTLAFGTAYRFPGGSLPATTLTAGAVDLYEFVSDGTYMHGTRLAAEAQPWTPLAVSPVVWLSGDWRGYTTSAGSTAVAADGDAVGRREDRSGNSNHPIQATAGRLPLWKTALLNGLPVDRYDGSNDYLIKSSFAGGALSVPFTVAIVFRQLAAGAGQDRVLEDGDDSCFIYSSTAGSYLCDLIAANSSQLRCKSVDYDWHYLLLEFNGASSKVRLDNKPEWSHGNAGSSTFDGLVLGADYTGGGNANMDVAEVVIAPGALSAGDKDSLFAYFDDRYDVLATADGYAAIDSSGFNSFCGAAIAANGDVVVTYRKGVGHLGDKGTLYLARSGDLGVTWQTPVQIKSDGTYDLRDPVGLARLASGRLALTYFRYPVTGTPLTDTVGYYTYSDDNGATWSASVALAVPAGYDFTAFWGKVVELSPGGTLLAPGYGIKTATGRYDSLLFSSADGGATWSKVGVIAAGSGVGPLDYTETAVITTTSTSNLLAVVRDDNGPNLYTTTSADGGATWAAPSLFLATGVSPNLLRLRNGRLLLTWGDRASPSGVSCLVSADHGATWSTWRYRPWLDNLVGDLGYPAAVEVSPGVVGVASYRSSSGVQATVRWDTFRTASVQ